MTSESRPATFLLALPCYNEGERLARFLPGLCRAIEKSGLQVRILPVDDGSDRYHRERYRNLMELHGERFPFLLSMLHLDSNRGKGQAVYLGWAGAETGEYLAFADADGAVGPEEVVRVLHRIADDPQAGGKLFAGSRIEDADTRVERHFLRQLTGTLFRILVKLLFGLPIEDTQCGFKVIPRSFFQDYKSVLVESGFAFDLELLYRAREAGLELVPVPVNWKEVKGGHMTACKSVELILNTLRLRRRLKRKVERGKREEAPKGAN